MSVKLFSILVWDEAASQIEEAHGWWQTHRPGAHDTITEDLDRAFALISRQPGVGTPARSRHLAGVRRLLLPRVGYFLYYRVIAAR